jgi:hypothetical protein
VTDFTEMASNLDEYPPVNLIKNKNRKQTTLCFVNNNTTRHVGPTKGTCN